jgi:hypothetical protein
VCVFSLMWWTSWLQGYLHAAKRDLQMCQKRPTRVKRDLHVSKETYTCVKRDLHVSKETDTCTPHACRHAEPTGLCFRLIPEGAGLRD